MFKKFGAFILSCFLLLTLQGCPPALVAANVAGPIVIEVAAAAVQGMSEHVKTRNTYSSSKNTSASISIKSESNQEVCKNALTHVGMKWDYANSFFRRNVDEARSRGLSEQDCGRILGRTTAVASSSSKASIITNKNDRSICIFALTGTGTIWETLSYFQDYVNEAKSRGLSEQECARTLGRISTVASSDSQIKGDVQASYQLIRIH